MVAALGLAPDFTLEDFRKQLKQLQQMGQMGEVPAGMPGMGDRITSGEDIEQGLRRIQGMIDAITKEERDTPDILDHPRCRRIAAGAGALPQDVERFLGHFQQVRVLMKQMAQLSTWREGGP
jgi:signal recognition particle subunit SRP54